MGRRRATKALNEVVHNAVHGQMRMLMSRGPVALETIMAESYIIGFDVGLRLAIIDIAAARKMVTALERMSDVRPGDDAYSTRATAELLEALSK